MREITIEGVISVPEGITSDQLSDQFIEWIEQKGYSFGGMIADYLSIETDSNKNPI